MAQDQAFYVMSQFYVKFATNQKEVESAQRLRFEVFNLEMNKGLAGSYYSGLDRDAYDPLCEHLLIIDNKTQKTIGTYRLLLGSRLGKDGCFYAESEFELSNIRALKKEVMEMGRSCVHKDYRSNAILHLLWAAIMSYAKEHGVGYLIGCPSVYTNDPVELSAIYDVLKKSYFAPEELRVYPREGRAVEALDESVFADADEKKTFLKLPALIRGYLKVGAVICGPPAVDREFGSVDFFMLLDLDKTSQSYLKRFHAGDSSL